MKTPIVQELRRAGYLRPDVHKRQKALVARSLVAVGTPKLGWTNARGPNAKR